MAENIHKPARAEMKAARAICISVLRVETEFQIRTILEKKNGGQQREARGRLL